VKILERDNLKELNGNIVKKMEIKENSKKEDYLKIDFEENSFVCIDTSEWICDIRYYKKNKSAKDNF
jgi:hypothetical protein